MTRWKKGVRVALSALDAVGGDVGRYGLGPAPGADASRLEDTLRSAWAHDERLGRACVRRVRDADSTIRGTGSTTKFEIRDGVPSKERIWNVG